MTLENRNEHDKVMVECHEAWGEATEPSVLTLNAARHKTHHENTEAPYRHAFYAGMRHATDVMLAAYPGASETLIKLQVLMDTLRKLRTDLEKKPTDTGDGGAT